MGIADVGEKIVVKIEETNCKTSYIKHVGEASIGYTVFLEEALTFQDTRTAEAALKALVAICRDVYRPARGIEAIEDFPGQRTIAVVKMKVTFTPVISTVLLPTD
jgi:hypothetical protein